MGPSVSLSVRNPFLNYALQDKVQLGYISVGQLGVVVIRCGQLGSSRYKWGSTESSEVKSNQKGSSRDRLEVKWGLV